MKKQIEDSEEYCEICDSYGCTCRKRSKITSFIITVMAIIIGVGLVMVMI